MNQTYGQTFTITISRYHITKFNYKLLPATDNLNYYITTNNEPKLFLSQQIYTLPTTPIAATQLSTHHQRRLPVSDFAHE